MDYIQEQLFNNSKNVIKRNSKAIYYDCTNYFFEIDEEEKYDGYYALTTNIVGDINEILKIVKVRWEIEESFRIMKSGFLSRPVNLFREDSIEK